ncbi:MAG TPA: DUF3090 family protein [Acidimicrobiales bacterium]|jgi:uncharacterized repeat protein (TIGR03847 family)
MNGHELDRPERFTVGTVGEVGNRTFLIQCSQGAEQLTLKLEKNQVAVLASYLARIVRELGRPGTLPEDLELVFDEDDDPDWVVGTIGVSYDEPADRLVVQAQELVAEGEDGDSARIAVTREQAAAFAIRATQLVEAGRPPCPLCGLPLDPSGHDCPRTNGHRPPAT